MFCFCVSNIVVEKRKKKWTYARVAKSVIKHVQSRGILFYRIWKKDAAKGNQLSFCSPFQATYTCQRTYPYHAILYIFRVTIPTLILNAITSRHMNNAHVSALQTRLQSAALLDRARSLARIGPVVVPGPLLEPAKIQATQIPRRQR